MELGRTKYDRLKQSDNEFQKMLDIIYKDITKAREYFNNHYGTNYNLRSFIFFCLNDIEKKQYDTILPAISKG